MNSMIKIYMKVCCMALCLLGLTSQYVQAQVCTSSYSQDWNGSGTTYMSNLGLATVTFESPDMAGSNTTSFSPNGNFFNMDMGWWTPNTLVGAQSLQYTFNWDDTPDGVEDAGVDAVTKTVTITYSQPVMNPIVHIDRLGGNFAADGVNQPYFSNSSMWTLTTAGVGVTKVSGNDQLVVNGNAFYREPNVDLGSENNPIGGEADGSDGVNGTAAGTLMFTGMVTSLTFDVTGVGPDGLGAIDGIEMIFEANLGSQASFTATPNPNCDGLAVDVVNTSVYDVNNDAVTFSWIFDYPGDVDSNEETPQVTYATGGSYMLALIIDDGSCQDTTMQTVTVNALGDPTASYNVDVSDCGAPIMVDLTDNSTSDTEIAAYEWVITLPDGTSVTVTEPQGSLTLEEEGTVGLVYTVTNANGCTSSISESIEVTSEEFVLEIEDTSGCEGTVATVGTLEEGISIIFSPDNVTVDGNSLTVLVGSGMQTYTYTADNGTCTYDGTFTVSDEGVANEIDVVEMLSVCSGGSGTIASDLLEGISVVSDPAGLTTIVDNTLLVVGVDASTLIDLAITYSNGCTSSASVDVAVVEGPEVDLPATVALCEGQNGSTSVDLPTGGSIQWTADGDVTIMSNGSTVTYSTGAMGGNLYATVTNEIGCETMAQIAVTTIMDEMLTLPESISVCEGKSGMLSLSNSAGSDVLWSTMGNVAIEGIDTDNSVTFTVGEGGGNVLVTVTSDSGCVATAQVAVIAGELPEANLPETVYACEGQTIDLPFDPNYIYTLTGNGDNDCVMTGSGTIDGNMLSFPFAMTGSGATMPTFCTLEVEIIPADCEGVIGSEGCCSVTQTVNVQITPDPLNPVNTPITQCEGQSVVLNPDALEGYTYSWSSFPFYAFDNAAAGSQEVLVTENTAFFVSATANDGSGCEFTAQIDVEYNEAPVATLVPNITEVELCPGDQVSLSYETDATEVWCYYTYTGSGTGLTTVFTGSGTVMGGVYDFTFADTGSGSGQITKVFYDAEGCFSEYIIPVNINDADVYINADADVTQREFQRLRTVLVMKLY